MSRIGATGPSVTVVVPTRDRPVQLEQCLAALARQTHPPCRIVVVDDRSVDGEAVAQVVARCPGAVVVAGSGAGPAAARNRGVAAADSDVICFTDDDCRPDREWIRELLAAVAGGVDVVAGSTVPPPASAPFVVASQVITNHLMSVSANAERTSVTFAPTCNLACTIETARRFPFDETFPLAAGEDREWCSRVVAAGVRIACVETAVVAHAPALGWRGFLRQQSRYGRGALHWRARLPPASSARQPIGFYGQLLRRAAAASWSVAALVVVAQAATAWGLTGEWVRARRR